MELARRPVVQRQPQHVLPGYDSDGGAVHVVLPSSTFVPVRVALLRDHLVAHLGKQLAKGHRECTAARGARRVTRDTPDAAAGGAGQGTKPSPAGPKSRR